MLDLEQLTALQDAADAIYVDRAVVDYAVTLVLATREPSEFGLADIEPFVSYGASPRASLGLIAAGRALALLRDRSYVLPQDVFDVAPDIMRHRLVLSYEALAQGTTTEDILARLLSTVPAPRIAPSQDHDERPVDAPPAAVVRRWPAYGGPTAPAPWAAPPAPAQPSRNRGPHRRRPHRRSTIPPPPVPPPPCDEPPGLRHRRRPARARRPLSRSG